jgi:hypothetical protein
MTQNHGLPVNRMRPGVPDVHITDAEDAQLAAYRPLAGQAVLGLIGGLLAPLAMIDPLMWAVPVFGLVFSWWALRRIRRYAPAMAGRGMALCGLFLSVLFLATASSEWLAYRAIVRREARQFAPLWFRYLAQDEPQKAHQLTMPPAFRQPLDDRLWAAYRKSDDLREGLQSFVGNPLVKTLLALGPKAQVRFYRSAGQARDRNNDLIDLTYAVTYEEEGEKKSFFVSVQMMRIKMPAGGADWRILKTEGGVRPAGW